MNRTFGSVWAALIISVMAAGSAQAGWMMTHGSAAQISEYHSVLDYNWRDEDGLTVVVRTNHYVYYTIPLPMPSDAAMQLTKVKVAISTGFSAAITKVKIYDGATLLSELNGNWWGPRTLYLKIAPRTIKNGLMLDMTGHASFTPDISYRWITIHNAGGLYRPAVQ